MFVDILDFVVSIYTVILRRLHRIFRGLQAAAAVTAAAVLFMQRSEPCISEFVCLPVSDTVLENLQLELQHGPLPVPYL